MGVAGAQRRHALGASHGAQPVARRRQRYLGEAVARVGQQQGWRNLSDRWHGAAVHPAGAHRGQIARQPEQPVACGAVPLRCNHHAGDDRGVVRRQPGADENAGNQVLQRGCVKTHRSAPKSVGETGADITQSVFCAPGWRAAARRTKTQTNGHS
jgi:hypothetical protein